MNLKPELYRKAARRLEDEINYGACCAIDAIEQYTFCEGSPYFAASRAFCIGSDSKWQAAAEAEIQFLTSLLPNETQS